MSVVDSAVGMNTREKMRTILHGNVDHESEIIYLTLRFAPIFAVFWSVKPETILFFNGEGGDKLSVLAIL